MRRSSDKEDGLPYAEQEIPRGQAMREFAEWAAGKPLPPGQVSPDEPLRITDGLIQRLVGHALATLFALTDRGHFKAAQFLVQLGLGSTEKPFSEQVQSLTHEEARQKLFEVYKRKGLTDELAWKMVDSKRAVEAPAPALPAPKEKE